MILMALVESLALNHLYRFDFRFFTGLLSIKKVQLDGFDRMIIAVTLILVIGKVMRDQTNIDLQYTLRNTTFERCCLVFIVYCVLLASIE